MAARGLPLQPSSKVVILGGGLQGCASAYYLKQRGFEDVTIVARTSVAAAASGKGGGPHEAGARADAGAARGVVRPPRRAGEDAQPQDSVTGEPQDQDAESARGELGLRGWPPSNKPAKAPFSPDAPAWLDKEDTRAS